MRRQILYVTFPVCLAIVVAGAWLANAGDPNPPVGPVQPTMNTLEEIYGKAVDAETAAASAETAALAAQDPRIAVNASNTPGDADSSFKITEPGSYYMTGNITGATGKHGIEIAALGVTLDLNGFLLDGAGIGLSGITISGSRNSIFNGTVRYWGGNGISASGTYDSSFARLRLRSNQGHGLNVAERCILTDCIASGNEGYGFFGTGQSVFNRCVSSGNSQDGFRAGNRCIMENCIAYGNVGDGFYTGWRSIVKDCISENNDGDGIKVGSASVVLNNNCSDHASSNQAGIRVTGDRSRIEGNHVEGNGVGIDAVVGADHNIIIRNTAVDNTTSYNIDSGNYYGDIVAPSGGPFSNSNPWANFSMEEG